LPLGDEEQIVKTIDILIADDEPHIVRALSFIFSKAGFVIDTAVNGEEALSKCRSLTPRVAFFDLVMPKMDGIQLCQLIKAEIRQQPPYIIILTCKGQDIDKEMCLKAGANDFMTKPFSPKEVMEKVRFLLGEE
jgi:two-component system alkaline phosphatase synthesis response regulator PhoP